MDGQTVGIKTSAIEEKCQAFETLVIYSSTLGARFAPYLPQSLELALPGLRFYFHDGVREACAMYVSISSTTSRITDSTLFRAARLTPILLACGKSSGTLTHPMVSVTFQQLISCISTESDSSFLASLYKCFADALLIVGGPTALAPDFVAGIMDATKRQLQVLADRRKARAARSAVGTLAGQDGDGDGDRDVEDEDLALLEEMEDFALEDMGKMLVYFDKDHPLLVAVASVRNLAVAKSDNDDDGDSEG